jgi:transcriptional regulator NrdR family protein
MRCPRCGGATRVVRTIKRRTVVLRRRRCSQCDYKFTTSERTGDLADRYM